jgi:hypothetical protein
MKKVIGGKPGDGPVILWTRRETSWLSSEIVSYYTKTFIFVWLSQQCLYFLDFIKSGQKLEDNI